MDKYYFGAAAALGLLLSVFGVFLAQLNGVGFAVAVAILATFVHILSFFFASKLIKEGNGKKAAWILASPIFITMLIVTVPLMLWEVVGGK